jgi:hypothetical protein
MSSRVYFSSLAGSIHRQQFDNVKYFARFSRENFFAEHCKNWLIVLFLNVGVGTSVTCSNLLAGNHRVEYDI